MRAFEFVGKNAYLLFELEVSQLPPIKKQEGPPITSRHHTQEFLAKYEGNAFLYLEGNRWIAEIRREAETATSLLEKFIRQSPDKLIEAGIPKYVAMEITKARILGGQQFFTLVKRDRMLSSYLREKYFVEFVKGL